MIDPIDLTYWEDYEFERERDITNRELAVKLNEVIEHLNKMVTENENSLSSL